jgi:hypothetical protein
MDLKKILPSTLLLTLAAACGGEGTVAFTSWGEDYIEVGLPLDDTATPEPDGFTDGWTVKYTKFVLVYKDIALAQKTGAVGPKQTGALVLDLTKPGPTTLLSFSGTPSGKWDRVSYALAPDAAAQAVGAIATADAEKMRSEGLDLWLEGTGTKDAAVKHFSWAFSQDTLFEDCTNEDFGEGVTVPNGGTETVQLTTHGDHLFYDDLSAETAKMRFAAIAAADHDADGTVTLDELRAVSLTSLPVGQYGTAGASGVKTLKDFVSQLTRHIGHYRGEGSCSAKVRK